MKLNQKKKTHLIADNRDIAVEYCFTRNEVQGKLPAAKNVWAIITFRNPETKHIEKLRVQEPLSMLEASSKEICDFLEKEVECFFKHCDEEIT